MRRSAAVGAQRGTRGAIALVAALLVGGGLGVGLYVLDGRGLLPVKLPLPERARASMPLAPSATPSAAPSAALSAAPDDTASPSAPPASASASPPGAPASGVPSADASPGVSAGACIRGLFASDTFTSEPELPFVCEEADAASVVSQLKTQIVVEGRGRPATGGMKEWAVLGFYELATVAVLRGRCCPGAPPLTVADAEPCKLGEALTAVGVAARTGASRDDLATAVKSFDVEVRCLMKVQQTARFGHEPLLGGEASTFDKTVARLE